MKDATLFSLIVFSKEDSLALYHEEYRLSSFNYFKRTSIQEMLRFLSTRVVQNLQVDVPQELIHRVDEGDSYKFFVKEKHNLVFVTASLLEYPSNTLSLLIEDVTKFISEQSKRQEGSGEVCATFEKKAEASKKLERERKLSLSKYVKVQLEEYQDYESKDIMLQIKNELGKVEEVLTKTIENALGRGEKIDELINSADSLSFQTKSLYRLSKKQNQKCCGIM
ncbi:synaptobrevin-like protein YKT6 [Nematocida sp. AWRm77]|nr:synaptobrevin-like protein YKT6 [Nematocida sp. AWRm77]